MLEIVSNWLKNSLPGIILLGAVGSLLAVGIGRAFFFLVGRVFPMPLYFHRRNRIHQAFIHGCVSAQIEKDVTGRKLMAYLAFKMAQLAISLFAFTLSKMGWMRVYVVVGREEELEYGGTA